MKGRGRGYGFLDDELGICRCDGELEICSSGGELGICGGGDGMEDSGDATDLQGARELWGRRQNGG